MKANFLSPDFIGVSVAEIRLRLGKKSKQVLFFSRLALIL